MWLQTSNKDVSKTYLPTKESQVFIKKIAKILYKQKFANFYILDFAELPDGNFTIIEIKNGEKNKINKPNLLKDNL